MRLLLSLTSLGQLRFEPDLALARPLLLKPDLYYLHPIMAKKPGRNAPCPCGSGKKYKKCCLLKEPHGGYIRTAGPLLRPSERTGTPYDDYLEVFPILGIYEQKILRFEEDGRELKQAVTRFEKRYRPGEPGGLTDSFFMSWLHYDFRFGPSLETIVERVLRDPLTAALHEPGPTLIRRLAESCLTFYEILEAGRDVVVFEELGTGKRLSVTHVRELYEIEPVPGEIWFGRLVGPPDKAILYTTPYVYDPETRSQFEKAVRLQEKDFQKSSLASLFPPERHFVESQKQATLFWAEFIHRGMDTGRPKTDEDDIADLNPGALPFMLTTDGDEVVFAKINFRVKDEPALRKRLAELRSFDYDKKDDSWIWLKGRNPKAPDAPRTVFGSFRIKDGRLVAETNSKERAARFRAKLKSLLGNLIAYDGTHWRDQHDLPEFSRAEIEAHRKESEELNSRPEVQEMLRKQQEHYYFTEWPKKKVPALGNRTPLQAAKTEEGRRLLKDLLEEYEYRQNTGNSPMPRLDIDRLRRMLGLPPKAN